MDIDAGSVVQISTTVKQDGAVDLDAGSVERIEVVVPDVNDTNVGFAP